MTCRAGTSAGRPPPRPSPPGTCTQSYSHTAKPDKPKLGLLTCRGASSAEPGRGGPCPAAGAAGRCWPGAPPAAAGSPPGGPAPARPPGSSAPRTAARAPRCWPRGCGRTGSNERAEHRGTTAPRPPPPAVRHTNWGGRGYGLPIIIDWSLSQCLSGPCNVWLSRLVADLKH